MRDESGLYHIVRDEDVIESEKELSWLSASYIRGDKDLLPEGYGFLHPNYQINKIYNDEGEKTGFSRIHFGGYTIVWEKMEKVEGKRFRKIRVEPEDAEEYFRRSEEEYRKYQEEYERKKLEGRYVIAATTHWKYEFGKQKSKYEDLSVGRIEGPYYYSPNIDERKKRVSAKTFHILREIAYDEQEQAREIIRKIKETEENEDFLDHVDFRSEDLFRYGEDAIGLKIRLCELLQEFTAEERCKVEDRLKQLKEEMEKIGTEAGEID